MAPTSTCRSPTSCSTSTRSTMICVKTGSTICSAVATTASPTARASTEPNGRTNGSSQAALAVSSGACSKASV